MVLGNFSFTRLSPLKNTEKKIKRLKMVSEKMMENEKHNISAVISRPGIKIKLSQHYYGQKDWAGTRL